MAIARATVPGKLMVRERPFTDIAFAESVTCAVKLKVPGVVGVPVMRPVEDISVRFGGSEPVPIDHVYGGLPPAAARV